MGKGKSKGKPKARKRSKPKELTPRNAAQVRGGGTDTGAAANLKITLTDVLVSRFKDRGSSLKGD